MSDEISFFSNPAFYSRIEMCNGVRELSKDDMGHFSLNLSCSFGSGGCFVFPMIVLVVAVVVDETSDPENLFLPCDKVYYSSFAPAIMLLSITVTFEAKRRRSTILWYPTKDCVTSVARHNDIAASIPCC